MKSVITVTQIDGATVQVNPQNIEAIIEVLPDSSTAYMYPKATFLIHMISGLIPVAQTKSELEKLLITAW
jgi:hypothetical protein